jgi:putative ABC transport system permease protein
MFDLYIDIDVADERFQPFQLGVRDQVSGQESTVTVIGILAIRLDPSYTSGVYVGESTHQRTFGAPEYQRSFIKLKGGVDDQDAARAIESALTTQGVQSDSIGELLAEANTQQLAFMRMFQGFMALGLFAGIAALGVVAFRSVVERRQQIGMLRAIGYQASTVAITFVLESSFIAVMGILAGVVGGVIISRNLFASGEFGEGIEFFVPWTELMLFVGLAFAVALIMTWYPSRKAAQVPVAEALRYE